MQFHEELTELQRMIAAERGTALDDVESEKLRCRVYLILASYRGLAEAQIGVAEAAERANWERLQESRF
jgi:hypothetical protein